MWCQDTCVYVCIVTIDRRFPKLLMASGAQLVVAAAAAVDGSPDATDRWAALHNLVRYRHADHNVNLRNGTNLSHLGQAPENWLS